MAGLPGADPEELEVAARRLSAAAAAVHRQVRRLEAAGRQTRWQGQGAEAFRRALADDVGWLLRSAERLEDAAAAVHAHAAAVRERLAALAAAAAASVDAVQDVASDAVDGVRSVGSDAVDALRGLGRP